MDRQMTAKTAQKRPMTRMVASARLATALLIIFMIAGTYVLHAQGEGIVVHKDDRIDRLMEIYTRSVQAREFSRGYRIQIMAGTSRDKAQKAQGNFDLQYPQYRSYLTYNSPYFKLRVGDFTERLEAFRFLQTIKNTYSGAFIVEDEVNLK
jgi:hypothetical protein